MNPLDRNQELQQAERAKALDSAKAILEMEQTQGWKHFLQAANDLITTMTPDVTIFSPDKATEIASQMAFVSGIKRCIGLMEQQRGVIGKPMD